MADPTSSTPASPAEAEDRRTRVLLAMLHSARDRSDREEARRLWLRIVVAEMERVRGLVHRYRDSSLPSHRIPPADIDDVAQAVFLRLHDKVDTLKGRSVGELRKFMSTATKYECLDYVDRYIKADQRRGASLDDSGDLDAAPGSRAGDDALARLAHELAADDETGEMARAVVHAGLAEVDDNKRAVIVMDLDGYPVEEIQERLGIATADNVYQLRRRGLKQLSEAIREQAGEDGWP